MFKGLAHCPHCGRDNGKTINDCPHCGQPITWPGARIFFQDGKPAKLKEIKNKYAAIYENDEYGQVLIQNFYFEGPRFKKNRGSRTINHKFEDNPVIMIHRIEITDKGYNVTQWRLTPEREYEETDKLIKARAYNI